MKLVKKVLIVPFLIATITPLVSCAYQGRTAGESLDDGLIKTKVHWHILNDPVITDSDITTTVRRGVVQLSGFTALNRSATEAAAKANGVDGVVKVVNNIIVDSRKPTLNETLKDKALSAEITWRLSQGADRDYSLVKNNVKIGTVQLAGFAHTKEDVRLAEEIVRNIKGVKKIINNVIVND